MMFALCKTAWQIMEIQSQQNAGHSEELGLTIFIFSDHTTAGGWELHL